MCAPHFHLPFNTEKKIRILRLNEIPFYRRHIERIIPAGGGGEILGLLKDDICLLNKTFLSFSSRRDSFERICPTVELEDRRRG